MIALARDLHSPRAEALRELGATVVRGDFDEPGQIAGAARHADALIATGTAHRAGPGGELRHGMGLADAAEMAGVRHVVYVSGDGAAPDSSLPLFRVKHTIEQRVQSLATSHTILAPVYFMENLFNPWNVPALRAGVLPTPVPPSVRLQQAAFADVVTLGVLAIESPERFAGKRIVVASDELNALEAAAAIFGAVGLELQARQHPPAAELPPGLRALFGWLETRPHRADLAQLRATYPEVGWHSYSDWARSERPRLQSAAVSS